MIRSIAAPFLSRTAQRAASSRRDVHYDIKIVEVGPRDGLQNEPLNVSTSDKIEFITKLSEANCPYIEATSFVSPKWVPTMADANQVMEGLQKWRKQQKTKNTPVFSCLVPNHKGFLLAQQAGADEVAIFGSASEAFSQKNINCSIADSIERFREVADAAKVHFTPLRGYVSCVLGCPYQGYVSPADVARVSERLLELGCHEVSLGDTIGIGTPGSTIAMLNEVQAVVDTGRLAVHFHDTYGQALANIYAAVEKGVTTIDSSVGGLGGCPYAVGASGNVATEDVVYMIHGMGLRTGIDLDKLIDAGAFIHDVLGRETRSKVAAAMRATRPKA